ncbi:hypothetical protein MVEN_01407400 [Mycena venus]|uniref:Uncharacterized protein n=1 Tax=Mycena venus TaxID=2733690 RepID=A0A8H6XVD3_9AGAR|nr:hypothetical protein MVEN_01407400 [Mycena venus]
MPNPQGKIWIQEKIEGESFRWSEAVALAAPAPDHVSLIVPFEGNLNDTAFSASFGGVDSLGHTTYFISDSTSGTVFTATIVAGSDYFSATEVLDQSMTVDEDCALQSVDATCTVRVNGVTSVVTVTSLGTEVLDVAPTAPPIVQPSFLFSTTRGSSSAPAPTDKPNSAQIASYSAWQATIVIALALARQVV